MSKLDTGSNRYLKAQLRPLTKPTFWASAGLFGVSLFALSNLFKQPDTVLGSGDRDAVVNLDENDSLTPEERARAAEIDDLSVLLKDLDRSQTIDSVSNRLNDAQTTNLETPEAIADLEKRQPSLPAATSSGQFTPLPAIEITLANSGNNQANNRSNSTGSGFIGFDPRSSGQVGVSSASSFNGESTPLAAALERYGSGTAGRSATFQQGTGADTNTAPATPSGDRSPAAATLGQTSGGLPNGAQPSGQRSGILSNGVQPNGSPTYSSPTYNGTLFTPGLANPSGNSAQSQSPQTSNDNAYTQIFNPNLVVPSAPTLPQPAAPSLPAQPAATSPNFGGNQPGANTSPLPQATASPASAVFGAPSSSSPGLTSPAASSPVISNPAPFSVPNTTPGQYSGNGKINTFANP